MIYLILDFLISNYTIYNTYFFLYNLNQDNLFLNLVIAFLLDYWFLNTYFLNIIIIIIFYLIKKYIFKYKYKSFFRFYLENIFFVLCYYFITMSLFSYLSLYSFLRVFIINSIFIILMDKIRSYNIKLDG